jgi:hypothetical protein
VPVLRAQDTRFWVSGGVAVPLGDFDDVVKVGWQGTAGVSVAPRSLPIGLQVDGTFGQFADQSPLDLKNQWIYGTVNAVYRFSTSEESTVRPYLIGGAGVYNSKETGSDALGGSSTKFGLNAGAGFDFSFGGARLFVEGRFHDVLVAGPNLQFIPITIGIRFGE